MEFQLLQDGLPCLVWLLGISLVAWKFQRSIKQVALKQLFWAAFSAKVFCGLLYGAYVAYILQSGDSYSYFQCISLLREDHVSFSELISSRAGAAIFPYHIYFTQSAPLAMVKLGYIHSFICFGSFWAMCTSLAALSFGISWWLFTSWQHRWNAHSWYGAICIFFLPSVLIWGTGWGKDAFIWLLLCSILASWLSIQKGSTTTLGQILFMCLLCVAGFLLVRLKPAMAEILLLALSIGILSFGFQQLKQPLRWVFLGFIGISSLGLIIWQSNYFVELITYQQWHSQHFFAGDSAYSLGSIDQSWKLFAYLPYLILSGLFRPFPWEWQSGIVLFIGVETLLIIVILLIWTFKVGWRANFSCISISSFHLSLFTFACVLAVASILFSQNFGTLFRYRMPAICLFMLSLWPTTHFEQKNRGIFPL